MQDGLCRMGLRLKELFEKEKVAIKNPMADFLTVEVNYKRVKKDIMKAWRRAEEAAEEAVEKDDEDQEEEENEPEPPRKKRKGKANKTAGAAPKPEAKPKADGNGKSKKKRCASTWGVAASWVHGGLRNPRVCSLISPYMSSNDMNKQSLDKIPKCYGQWLTPNTMLIYIYMYIYTHALLYTFRTCI